MRNNWWAGAAVVGVVLLGHGATALAGKTAPTKKAAPEPKAVETRPTERVVGFGRDRDTAILVAGTHAQQRIRQLLIAKYGEDWIPPDRLLTPESLKELKAIALEGEPKEHPDLKNAPDTDAKILATYKVELSQELLREVRNAAREERMQNRHLVMLRILGGALVLLMVTAGYLRLEEWTRGYATRLLRATAAAIVLLAAVGLWWSCI